jgi:ribosomal protein S18
MPHHFSLKHASRTGPVGRRPKLGPDARDARARDPFLALRVDPLAEAANTALVSAFVTDMGKIHGRAWTGLSRRSQRRAGQAVRRARMLGLIPWLSRRPLAQGVLTRTARGVSVRRAHVRLSHTLTRLAVVGLGPAGGAAPGSAQERVIYLMCIWFGWRTSYACRTKPAIRYKDAYIPQTETHRCT